MRLVLTSWGFFILANLTLRECIFLSPIFTEISDQATILKGYQLLDFYWPQHICGQVDIFTPVCHSFGSPGGDLVSLSKMGYEPPTRPLSLSGSKGLSWHTPRSRHPPEQSRRTQTPRSRHPPGADTFFSDFMTHTPRNRPPRLDPQSIHPPRAFHTPWSRHTSRADTSPQSRHTPSEEN